jgi:hypothetical protein
MKLQLQQLLNRPMKRLFLLSLGLVFLQGCTTTLKSKADLDRITQRNNGGLGNVFYTGTKLDYSHNVYHYITDTTRWPSRHYRISDEDYSFRHWMPKTSDESFWIPYLIDLGDNSKGFQGDKQEPIIPGKPMNPYNGSLPPRR